MTDPVHQPSTPRTASRSPRRRRDAPVRGEGLQPRRQGEHRHPGRLCGRRRFRPTSATTRATPWSCSRPTTVTRRRSRRCRARRRPRPPEPPRPDPLAGAVFKGERAVTQALLDGGADPTAGSPRRSRPPGCSAWTTGSPSSRAADDASPRDSAHAVPPSSLPAAIYSPG